jgi:hypothetical protein
LRIRTPLNGKACEFRFYFRWQVDFHIVSLPD